MTKEELTNRIDKVNVKIEKVQKLMNKYYNELSDDLKKYINLSYAERRALNLPWEEEDKLYAYISKKNEFETLTNTLNKYKNLLKQEDELVDVPVLKEFIENWKTSTIKYHIELCEQYLAEYDEIKETYPKDKDEYWKEISNLKMKFGEYICSLILSYKNKKINVNKIEYDVNEDARRKYKILVNRISSIAGNITDAKGLRIGGNGEINGIVKGDKGTAKIETIIAGGYNQNIIVNVKHGQIAHYRVLVKEIK